MEAKPYARFFDDKLSISPTVLPALQAERRHEGALNPARIGSLLHDGDAAVETGCCALPDGSGYVASRVEFEDCPLDAFRWRWWHALEPEPYALWFPHCHVSVSRDDGEALADLALTDEQRYAGSTHRVTEYIGSSLTTILIEFTDPAAFGLDAGRSRGAAGSTPAHG